MADLKATKGDKTYAVDDGEKRGPLTLARLRLHPTVRAMLDPGQGRSRPAPGPAAYHRDHRNASRGRR